MGNEIVKAPEANAVQPWAGDPEFSVTRNFEGGAEPRLPRIEVIHRGQMFREVSTGETFKDFSGNILHYQRFNGWWSSPFAEGQEASPPDCGSSDAIRPDQGDEIQANSCATCEKNKFGTHGKECKNNIRIHVLRAGELLPVRIVCPATSLKPFSEYISHLTMKNIPMQMGITKFELEKSINPQGIEYSKLKLSVVGYVSTKEIVAHLKAALAMNRPQFQRKEIGLDETPAAAPEVEPPQVAPSADTQEPAAPEPSGPIPF